MRYIHTSGDIGIPLGSVIEGGGDDKVVSYPNGDTFDGRVVAYLKGGIFSSKGLTRVPWSEMRVFFAMPCDADGVPVDGSVIELAAYDLAAALMLLQTQYSGSCELRVEPATVYLGRFSLQESEEEVSERLRGSGGESWCEGHPDSPDPKRPGGVFQHH